MLPNNTYRSPRSWALAQLPVACSTENWERSWYIFSREYGKLGKGLGMRLSYRYVQSVSITSDLGSVVSW